MIGKIGWGGGGKGGEGGEAERRRKRGGGGAESARPVGGQTGAAGSVWARALGRSSHDHALDRNEWNEWLKWRGELHVPPTVTDQRESFSRGVRGKWDQDAGTRVGAYLLRRIADAFAQRRGFPPREDASAHSSTSTGSASESSSSKSSCPSGPSAKRPSKHGSMVPN